MSAPDPVVRQIQAVQFTDSEIRRIATNAAKDASGIMATLAQKGTASSAVRSAQIALANMNLQMWANVGDATKVGIGDAVWGATEGQALFDESMFARAGVTQEYWRASMMATANQGIESLIARKQNGITLSQNVWNNTALSKGKIDDAINSGLALGKSPAEIAKSVVGFVSPNVPGGASYAAMRLGRSEVLNAYHTTAINNYKKSPWVHRVMWNLSGSHPRPDECNEFADNDEGYLPTEVPDKPHPNCLCYITPQVLPFDEFKKNFDAGKYDSHISKEMGCMVGV